jgi:6-pyruvoyltetrahydropterin/6-carboxytetrahydropterin synthase
MLSSEFGKCHRLHGHLYMVRVEVYGTLVKDQDVLIDFRELKGLVEETVAPLDHKILLPGEAAGVIVRKEDDGYSVRVGQKDYFFPLEDVALLPISATSCENLATFLQESFENLLPGFEVRITVEEAPGTSITAES